MQAKMECARRGLTTARRYFWHKGSAVETTEVSIEDETLTRTLRTWDSGTWKAAILQISCLGKPPVEEPEPYAFLLNEMPMNTDWIATGEANSDGIFHVHALVRNPQRTDAWIRSANSKWFSVRCAALNDVEDTDPMLTILKCQTAHKPSSLACYMVKNPVWLIASSAFNLKILSGLHDRDMGDRFRPENSRKFKLDANKMTTDLIDIISDHNCKTAQDVFRCAPEVIVQYLHRPGFGSILNNCLAWVQATQGGWSMANIAKKYKPIPIKIHQVLLHQGIVPSEFDEIFFKWITKAESKRNTLVLWGPSNTGKSMFIKGFKEAVPWGEIVNSNQFAFESLCESMFGVWEEPLISSEQAEKCKQIFEGMETSVPVKYKKPFKLPRIPIIMTTNHAPWRYCSNEEPMFRNRMWIFEWLNDCTGLYSCRVSEYSCECCVCKASRSGKGINDGQSACKMPRGQQPIQGLAFWIGRTEDDVSPGSLCSGSQGSCRSPKRGDCERSTSPTSQCQQQCSDSSGSGSSSSSSTINGLRPSGEHRPSNPRKRIRSAEPGDAEPMVTEQSGGDHGGDLGRHGMGEDAGEHASGSHEDPGRSGGECSSSSPMVVLGETRDSLTPLEIFTAERELGRKMGALSIPTRNEWLEYLSFLQTTYSNKCNL